MIRGRGERWGEEWGAVGEIPHGALAVRSDAEAAAVVAKARRAGTDVPAVVLAGGDLARTLGVSRTETTSAPAIPGAATTGSPRTATPSADDGAALGAPGTGARALVDVGSVLVDGVQHYFVAHLVARRSWLRGRLLVAANASFIGSWNIAPRAHPGDGRLDTFDAQPSLSVRLAARRRLAAGTHIPHPDIVQRRITAAQFTLNPALDVHLDGRRVARASALSVRVALGALEVWIPSGG